MKTEYKIIADHLRSSCFLIADGALPSNEGRGYVLRRIMRRAMLQLHKLGTREVLMYKFVDGLIAQMGEAYPELSRARSVIVETLKNEEEKFRETLEKGLKILEEEISKQNVKILPGAVAFKLYDTYGFPLDLTETILREKNIAVDVAEFESEMEKQRERAKASWSGSGAASQNAELLKLKEEISATKFLGYNQAQSDSTILCILIDGKKVDEISSKNNGQNISIILDQTPFYATSGGQKGDDGKLFGTNNSEIEIATTQKIDNLFLHIASKINGNFKVGEKISAKINQQTRLQRAQNHSATHLMHKALKLILGNSISQKGSNVDANYFTFDFNFNRAMNSQEIAQVEDLVNFYIAQNSSAQTKIMALDKAREMGAEALFGEKYDNEVRVVAMGEDEKKSPYSIELCGGTHIKSTGEIEFFKIISEKSIASGIRRIEAKTGDEAKNFVLDELQKLQEKYEAQNSIIRHCEPEGRGNPQQNIMDCHAAKAARNDSAGFDYALIKQKIKNLSEEIIKQEQEIKAINKKNEQEKLQNLLKNLENCLKIEKIGEISLISAIFEEIEVKDLREIVNHTKNQENFKDSSIFAFFATSEEKVAAVIAISNNLLDKYDASALIKDVVVEIGGKGGGGKKDLAMGGGVDKKAISKAINNLKEKIYGSKS